ncbi:2-phospho-L-lactate guanylyltransferase [Microbacterium hominis]|uniref:Phosphoenolpyruvate guanylyltransferase n=1 Tax=Microbacterium hominis TaxID=162426 RepID=A0A7D4Q4N0_9MICO|nr:2-phospho-L-lactate guanylyltransferase [Microbacterium hominis]QKJ20751.1 2-phospho-L-lactate guanylyltransferase [Microbacterium hominis]
MTASPAAAGWAVVVPVKDPARGKSRLSVDGVDRATLARAIALDTVAAVAVCDEVARVIVVTDDAALPAHAGDIPGVRWVDETFARERAAADAVAGRPGAGIAPAGLDGAIALGIATAGEGMPRAALLGDLPALRADDLGAALRAAASRDRAVVADGEGTGSTLVTAAPGVAWRSSFGDGSFARHVALGCTALAVEPDSTLRRDVDTAAQLRAALALGVGPRTAALLARP